MKLGAFMVTYNRSAVLSETLGSLFSQTRPPDKLIVVDNASNDDTELVVRNNFPHVEYVRLKENIGPAGAAGYGLSWAIGQECDWIYWGDDDDPPGWIGLMGRLLEVADALDSTEVAAIGAVGSLWDWSKGEFQRIPDVALQGVVDVDVIGGGQQLILRRQAVEDVGLPDPNLFFGLDDLEYCLRLRLAGYRLIVDGEVMLRSRAQSGRLNLTQREALAQSRRMSPNSARRQYYSTRNYIYMMREKFGRPDLARRQIAKALGRACRSWSTSARHGAEFSNLQLRGVIDGYLGRMGRTIDLSNPQVTASSIMGKI